MKTNHWLDWNYQENFGYLEWGTYLIGLLVNCLHKKDLLALFSCSPYLSRITQLLQKKWNLRNALISPAWLAHLLEWSGHPWEPDDWTPWWQHSRTSHSWNDQFRTRLSTIKSLYLSKQGVWMGGSLATPTFTLNSLSNCRMGLQRSSLISMPNTLKVRIAVTFVHQKLNGYPSAILTECYSLVEKPWTKSWCIKGNGSEFSFFIKTSCWPDNSLISIR